jgi:hypothetical protein
MEELQNQMPRRASLVEVQMLVLFLSFCRSQRAERREVRRRSRDEGATKELIWKAFSQFLAFQLSHF